MGEIAEGHEDRILLEAKEKEEKDYIRASELFAIMQYYPISKTFMFKDR